MVSSHDALDFLINHVVFPAKLPQQEEDSTTERRGEQLLTQLLNDTLKDFLAKCAHGAHDKWKPVCSALQHLASGWAEYEGSMKSTLRGLEPGDATFVHVKAQNAGLLLFRVDAESILVHVFEASALSGHVVGSCDRLTWRFPGQTISFSSHLLNDDAFVDELAIMVLQMSTESVESCMQTTTKAQSTVPEERETAHPRLVTEALMAMLSAWGMACQTPNIVKHIRDDNFMAFFIARVCNNIVTEPVDADVKMIAATKAARRLSKLRDSVFPFVRDAVRFATENICAQLNSAWSEIQTRESPSIPILPTEATNDDCTLLLSNSRQYLQAVALGQNERPELPDITLESGPRLEFEANDLPQLRQTPVTDHNLFLLTDFEAWVMNDLQSWTKHRDASDLDCDSLLNVMRTYLKLAGEEYQDNPRALSVMLLTILDIWTALDTLCLRLYPLLRKFGPAIPAIGNPLLLPHLCQMQTLDRIESYLAKRWMDWEPTNPSIFGPLSSKSFCVQFYAQSQPHQAVRKQIEDEASATRERKRSELVEATKEYHTLVSEASRMKHSKTINYWGRSVCESSCQKCSHDRRIENMRIDVDEWPLPADEVQAQAVVFELDCPVGFSAWRDATWLIVQDLGRAKQVPPGSDVRQQLFEYRPLSLHAFKRRDETITLASHTKPFLRSHYHDQRVPVAFETIAVNNGLQYRLLDKRTECWVQDQSSPPSFDRYCISSLPSDPSRVNQVLFDQSDVADLVESSIYLNDNFSSHQQNVSTELRQSVLIDTKLSRSIAPRLRELIGVSGCGINDGIKEAYELPGLDGHWESVPGHEDRWLTCISCHGQSGPTEKYHYDILSGTVLLNGRRIGRLPPQYMSAPLYSRVFGSRILNVAQSNRPGMEYMAVKEINEHKVHLDMRNGELIIEADVGERRLRLVPPGILAPDLPISLTEGFVHWMDLRSNDIEFRPLESPWDHPERAWKLHFGGKENSCMGIGNKRLVDRESPLGTTILDILQALESRHRIVICSVSGGVEVEVPRMRLTFTVNGDGRLESKQLRGVVDPEQGIGCLFGLRNMLVFQNLGLHPNTPQRSVVIPYGQTAVSRYGDHSRVTIDPGHAQKLSFMHYQLDTRLSRLRSQQGAVSKLYLAYLHAVTSFALPDPLTGHTGTQEALRILREQSLRTSTSINEDVVPLLDKIAALTPSRFFYPEHLRKMQTVEFDSSLGQLAQHEDFHALVEDLIHHASQLNMLQAGPVPELLIKSRGDPHLLRRAANRNSCLRNTGLGRMERFDVVYVARDGNCDSAEARRVYEVASLVRLWPQKTEAILDLSSRVKQWEHIEGYNQKLNLSEMACSDLLKFPVGREWGTLYELCRGCNRPVDQYKLMRLFAMIVFEQADSVPVVRTLLGIACSGMFTEIQPLESTYNLESGESPDHGLLKSELSNYIPEPTKDYGESYDNWVSRLRTFRQERDREVASIVSYVSGQWPCDAPSVPASGSALRQREMKSECEKHFTVWNDNRKFMLHIADVQSELRKLHVGQMNLPLPVYPTRPSLVPGKASAVVAPDLISLLHQRTSPKSLIIPAPIQANRLSHPARNLPGLEELEGIVGTMKDESDPTRRAYAEDLDASLTSLKQAHLPSTPETIPLPEDVLLEQHAVLEKHVAAALCSLSLALRPNELSDLVLRDVGFWPRIDTASLLTCISAHRRESVPGQWREFLVSFGQLLSSLQRLERLLSYRHRNDIVGFYKEAEESGHQSWSATDFPDWLLIEIENNLTIREVQAEVARKMIQPDGGQNAVLQLNMGEGKSSVIVPMVMTALSDGKTLGRLVVLKPLLRQTLDLLSERMGGLVDRRIFHAPFNRDIRLDLSQVAQLWDYYEQCRNDQCIIVTLPEHMMSFRLMGRELLRTKPQLAWKLMDLDAWLDATCRDILDESDAILDPRFQLVYSIGNQRIMDGQPDRWVITQRLLALFASEAYRLQTEGSRDIEVDFRGRSFPMITFLNHDVGHILLDRVVEQIGRGKLLGISLLHCSAAVRQAVLQFIRESSVCESTLTLVEQEFGSSASWKILLLCRGLIANNVLLFALQQKRWLVNYGLDLSRCRMAVPYRAKGVPSISAEFGHPDVAIVLTCLSYYYSGLTSTQLRHAFENLFRESDPSSEYALWAQDCPTLSIQSLHGINLEDDRSWDETILPQLRFSKSAADYFMATVVFPHEGKEFPAKLSTSAWDIPSKSQPSTGFSGTNDNKFLLPLSIHQNDLPQLHRTNAMVANMLLQRENRQYVEAKDSSGKRLSTEGLLELLCASSPQISVFIDVGAQVLEASNEDVARKWLQLSPNADAAVFFDEADEKRVLDRHGFVERLSNSGFHQNLDRCLIYLDEVHTRGVDISMPTHARAAVTLGPRTTKDRLVQACMRMRKLNCHQSLIFFAPPEVHQEILALSGKQECQELDSLDVLRWSFEQTCRATSSVKPLWIMQGLEHSHRERLCAEYLQEDMSKPHTEVFCSSLEEPEGRTLHEMYGGSSGQPAFRSCLTSEPARQDATVQHLLSEWATFKSGHSRDWTLQEEQEREIAHEVEQERELQRPPPAEALAHTLDPAVRAFVQNGTFPENGAPPCINPAFASSLRSTSAFPHLLHAATAAHTVADTLYATTDFVRTVALTTHGRADEFLRPITWLLSSRLSDRNDVFVIISPYEANALLPALRQETAAAAVRLHVYAAKTSRAMLGDFGGLDFYTVCGTGSGEAEYTPPPPLLVAQLGLLAGSLFFDSYAAYRLVADFLGIVTDAAGVGDGGGGGGVGADGFVQMEKRRRGGWPVKSPFVRSPVVFVEALVGMRRKGHVYSQTHLGHLCGGRVLAEESFGEGRGGRD
ncbi:hypothetical protein SLS55_010400 [Diplodia seriata]|uniref:ubiquitinyl hydrolase 1 n=1 Tax=Diplodia seriata TaxID=420778 RepID=A0ABR3BYF1_9PEZI